jgi:hypothetical protein
VLLQTDALRLSFRQKRHNGRVHLLQDCQRQVRFQFARVNQSERLQPLTRPENENLVNGGFAGDIPSLKLFESDKILAFLDIEPLSRGHAVRLMAPF